MNFSRTLFGLSRAHFFQFFTGKKFSFTDTNSRKFHGHFQFFTGTFFDFFRGWNSDFQGKKKHCVTDDVYVKFPKLIMTI